MPRESVADKARRYVCEGRLQILEVGPERIRAICKGRGEVYDLGWNPHEGWFCRCPARTRCCHLEGLQLVVSLPRPVLRAI